MSLSAQPFGAKDEASFLRPDKSFYPETWFHFIGGNVSKAGIDADLQAITDAKISGIQWFHGYSGGPWPGTAHWLSTLSPEWEDMVAYLARKTDSLGLKLTIQTCPGWSMAGGPWITPENAMRQLVWSRTDIPAGGFAEILPKGQPSDEEWRDYRDIRVLAFPTPLGDTGEPLKPKVIHASDSSWRALIEGANDKALQIKDASSNTVRFVLPEGSVIRTLSLPPTGDISHAFCINPGLHVRLTALTSSAGEKVLVDADVPMSNWQSGQPADMEFACNEAPDAESYTFTFTNIHPASVQFIRFYSAARKNSWRGEAGWTLTAKEPFQQHTRQNPLAFVQKDNIIDLTERMSSDGRLDWQAPAGDYPEGKWTVLRIGHVNLGRKNQPAPPEATGWECSKFDPKGAEIQFANYVGMLQDGPLGGKAGGMLMDSWECLTQTWTPAMEAEFKSDAGYPLSAWLPALMGYVINDQETTSRFLIDWRRTVNRLYCDNFFKRMTDLAHEKGMEVQYETAGGDVVTMDPMEYYKYADIPMCEFWHPISEGFVGDLDFKPIEPTASAAHLYGKPRIAAEGFTSFDLTFDEHWQMMREVANLNMAAGVSHIVFHTYTHNPQVGFLPPGTSFGRKIGTPFLRGQTWWKYMPLFTDYLARTGYMLERGHPVADILWYLGDEIDHKPYQYTGNGRRQSGDIRIPEGYKYDYCNPDALLRCLSVKDGNLITPDGIIYKVLWIPENERMLPETIEKIGELIRAGAKVISKAPSAPATLNEKESGRFADAASAIWGSTVNGKIKRIGKGCLAVGLELSEALDAFGLKPHIQDSGFEILWDERMAEGARWYFIAAPVGESFKGEISIEGKGSAEWWDPVDGSVKQLKTKEAGRMKKIYLDLARAQSGFIVFRENTISKDSRQTAFETGRLADVIIPSGWTIRFPQGWGAPDSIVALKELKPWKDLDLSDEGRAFSGSATYEAVFNLDKSGVGKDMILDLGKVDMIADVSVNGQSAGVRWTAPYRISIGDFVHEGENHLSVTVTSTWFNRLAYDASLPESERKTWTIDGPAAGSPLRDSGLMGPVKIEVR